jgi:hypothetical protein
VVHNNRDANAGTVNFGKTQLNQALEQTFKITNSGTSALTVDTGSFTLPAGYELVSGPSLTTINPGQESLFVVRLIPTYQGVKSGAITFTTDDGDESTVTIDITGEVLPYRIIDDQDAGYSASGMQSESNGLAYLEDTSYAHSSGPAATATWTFTGVTAGFYAIALTWLDGNGNSLYSNNTPVTVMDGAQNEGTVLVNQQDGPSSFFANGAYWQTVVAYVEITSSTVTISMTNVGANGYILADGAMLYRL